MVGTFFLHCILEYGSYKDRKNIGKLHARNFGFGGKNILKRHFGGQSEELEHGYDSRLCYRIIVNLLWCDNRIVIV